MSIGGVLFGLAVPGALLLIDLGTTKKISAVRLLQVDSTTNWYASQVRIQWSRDGTSNWQTVYTIQNPAADSGNLLIPATTARYWRFYASAGGPCMRPSCAAAK